MTLRNDIRDLFIAKKQSPGNLVSVILPVYNEELSLPVVVEELYQYLSAHQQNYRFEITFIDDCSRDKSVEVLKRLSQSSPSNVKVSVARLAKNSGSHVAITAGLNIARGNFIVIMASDGQDPASVIGELINEWKNGNELILASRADNLDQGAVSKFFSRLAWKVMNWSTNTNMPASGCDLLGFDKKVLDAFNRMDERNTTFIFRILSLGFRQKEISYIKRARVAGTSSWTLWKKMSIIADAMAGYTSRPLRLITQLGFIIFLVLMIRWGYVVLKIYLFGEIPDQLTIVLNTIFTSLAIQVLLLGFIGNYIWRILDETRKRPQYEISDIEGEIFNDQH